MSNNNNQNNNNSSIFGSGSTSDPSSQNRKEIKERQEEMQILTRFKDVVTNKLEQMSAEMEDEKQNKVYKMGDHEKKILLQMQGMGLAEGMAAGVATFVLLRRGPIWIGRFIRNRRGVGATGAPMHKSGPTKNNNPFHNASQNSNTMMSSNLGGGGGGSGYQLSNPFASNNGTAANPNFPRSRNPIVRGIWFMFDAAISLMMAANISVQYTDLKRIRNDLVELPLAEGGSLVSDAFCESLTNELQQIQYENSPAYQRLVKKYKDHQIYGDSSSNGKGISPLALYMEGITLFSQNCERRAFRQRELFQEQGGGTAADAFQNGFGENNNSISSIDDFSSIPIPPPGVAKDGPRLVRNYIPMGDDQLMMEDGKEEYTVVYSSSDNHGSDSGFSSF